MQRAISDLSLTSIEFFDNSVFTALFGRYKKNELKYEFIQQSQFSFFFTSYVAVVVPDLRLDRIAK